mmetsp:Transcript_10498/g.29710  ORF Transcript_10498/g.29710 Transcript_10498/m.29710 type:complete len:552 (-) Transcript_10498:49-1704(-)
MHAMVLPALLLLLGVRGAAGYRSKAVTIEDLATESLAQRRQLLERLSVVGTARPKNAKCETEVRAGVPSVLLVSGTGEGKSTTACALSGDPALAHVAEVNKADSETNVSCVHLASWFYPYDRTEPLYLIDTPGFGDTRGDKVIRENNDNIVRTLKAAGHVHAILWVLNEANTKMEEGRQNAFKFMRSYFGPNMYEHLVFVYTHFSWKFKENGKTVKGKRRRTALVKQHENKMNSLLDTVEKDFWPNGQVAPEVKDTILGLPCFGINTRAGLYKDDDDDDDDDDDEEVEKPFDDGTVVFTDSDLELEDYDRDDPDGRAGVFNPETFGKGVKPNSATQLRELKEKIVEISRAPPVDLTHLRPFQDGCRAALADTPAKTPPVPFGEHVTDCVEGQQYKLLKDKVAPYVSGLQDGPVFAAFGISAYTGGRGPAGSSLRVEAMKELGIPDSARESAEAFASYGAYQACRDAQPGQGAAVLVERLSTCLGGIASGHGVPALVGAMTERLFGEGAKAAMSAAYIAQVVAEIGKLPEHARAAVAAHVDVQGLMRSLLPW